LQPLYDAIGVCFTIESQGYRYDSNGDPLIEDCQKRMFTDYYVTKESLTAFNALYKNKHGLQDKFVGYWDATSAALASNPYTLGFDPLNEPFTSNFLTDPHLFVPGVQDRKELAPMYTRIFNEAYTKNDPESIMWFEPNQFPDQLPLLGGHIFPVGFQTPPGGEIGSNRHVLNDHTYCCAAGYSVCANAEPSADKAEFCDKFHNKKLNKRHEDAERLGVPLFISEFGACLTEANCTPEIRAVADNCDKHIAGWAYWEFKNYADLTTTAGTGSEGFYNQDGTLQAWKVKALARSYLQAAQGVPTKFLFNSTTGEFDAEFTIDTSIEEATIMYTSSDYWYPNGKDVTIAVDGVVLTAEQVVVDSSDVNHYKFTVKDESLNGKTLAVSCVPKLL